MNDSTACDLIQRLADIADAIDVNRALVSSQGQAMDGFTALANFRALATEARTYLDTTQPEPEEVTDERQWYSYCPEEGIELHSCRASAKAAADEIMGSYAKAAHTCGWHEDMEAVSWGMLIPVERARVVEQVEAEPGSEFDEWGLYELTPARFGHQPPVATPEPVATMRDVLEISEK